MLENCVYLPRAYRRPNTLASSDTFSRVDHFGTGRLLASVALLGCRGATPLRQTGSVLDTASLAFTRTADYLDAAGGASIADLPRAVTPGTRGASRRVQGCPLRSRRSPPARRRRCRRLARAPHEQRSAARLEAILGVAPRSGRVNERLPWRAGSHGRRCFLDAPRYIIPRHGEGAHGKRSDSLRTATTSGVLAGGGSILSSGSANRRLEAGGSGGGKTCRRKAPFGVDMWGVRLSSTAPPPSTISSGG